MLRLCVLLFNIAVFLADSSESGTINNAAIDEGSSYTINAVTFGHTVTICHLKTPHNDIISFKPGDGSQNTEKHQVEAGTNLAQCRLTIQNIDKDDEGLWVLSYEHDGDDEANTEHVNIIVHAVEPEEYVEEYATLLTMINHFTREEMRIDISLDKESFEEECYVHPPNGVLTKAKDFLMENVIVQSSSNYVSCRITIGPMTESLLGEWRICGKRTDNDEIRCQPANISWNNNNSEALWASLVQPMVSHPVHFGGSVNPGVLGTGNVVTCNVITPDDEDLVITSDVNYPHIERIAFNNPSLCSINFTNIDSAMIGDWSIYGKFRASTGGLNEVHLPLRFFLYNEDNPYEQAYNVTELAEDTHLVILGSSLDVDVSSVGVVDNCQVRTPAGATFDLGHPIYKTGVVLESVATATACRISLNPITDDMVGEWQIIGKFSNGNQYSERRQTFHVIKEDPENPIIDEFRDVENLTAVIVDTELGASHRITIDSVNFVENESCHLITPDGLQYAFILGFNVPNVEIIEENGIECGVEINVQNLDMLGEWTLIARSTRLSNPIERRLPFTIRIEETLSLGNAININEGADLYLSLHNATDMYYTCKLYGPNDEEITDFEIDPMRLSSCGYIVRNISHNQSGTWTIVYGNQITYRASVEVNVLESAEITVDHLVWTAGSAVNVTVGPEDAVYCQVQDNNGNVVFDGFGPCKIVMDRVTIDHEGVWTMFVGVTGTILLQPHDFFVDVQAAHSTPVVTTNVVWSDTSVVLTCSVPSEYEVQACKFRGPQGNILIASHGVGQGGYAGSLFSYELDAGSQCALRLMNPVLDEGIWRCAVDTTQDTYYGFLSFTGLSMYGDDHILVEPVLKSVNVHSIAGEAVTMSCSIDTAIRYCYFRASNGTVFNVGPSTPSAGFEYVGSGLDAGDCGIRFDSLVASDGGAWSCHVGLHNTTAEEQRASFNVLVKERMSLTHEWHGRSVSLHLVVANEPKLDYCRFVRIDGRGFTSDNVPSGYRMDSYWLEHGNCVLNISEPTMLDVHPWTVAAKIAGVDGEMSVTSSSSLVLALAGQGMPMFSAILLWIFFTVLSLMLVLAAVSLIPKKNRKWTYERAAHLRNSFRRQPYPAQHTDILTDLPIKV